MKENTVVAFQNPSDFQKDPLTEVLQAGARELLAQAVEAEVSVFLGSHAALVDAAGRRRVVRNGYLPERFIQTGIGPVSVRQPRVRDRGDGAIRFPDTTRPRCVGCETQPPKGVETVLLTMPMAITGVPETRV